MIASRRLLGAVTLVAALGLPAIARAQSAADQTLAQSLFDQGLKLANAGNFKEACPKFAESQRLDPGGGTLINLARCRESEGKLASAWAAYNEALSFSIKDGRKEREEVARAKIAALQPRLATLRIVVASDALGTPGFEITLDGGTVRQAAWGNPIPTDQGPHALTATAAGKVKWTHIEQVEKDGDAVSVTIPRLEDAPVVAPSTPVGAEAPPPANNNTAAWVVGSAGVASLLAGTITGILVLGKRSQSDSECTNGCTQRGVDLMNEAQSLAWVSDVTLGVGLGAVVVSAVLFFTSKPSAPATARILPFLGPGSAGLVGRF